MNQNILRVACVVALLFVSAPVGAQTAKARINDTPVRTGPTVISPVLTTVNAGAPLNVVDRAGDWYRVMVADRVGYVLVALVDLAAPLIVPPTAAQLREPTTREETLRAQADALQVNLDTLRGQTRPTVPLRPVTRGIDDRPVHTGTVEVMALGNVNSSSYSATDLRGRNETLSANSTSLTAFVGVFATPYLELGMSTSVLHLGMAELDTMGETMGHVFFNVPNSSAVVPFVGLGMGTTFGNGETIGHPFTVMLSGGFRVVMPGGGGALIVRPFYTHASVTNPTLGSLALSSFGIAIGASLLF